MDPTFGGEWRKPKAVFFQGIGAGDGNRTHYIQLGKLLDVSQLVILFQGFIPLRLKIARDFLGTSCG
jgi:hypothetical protein